MNAPGIYIERVLDTLNTFMAGGRRRVAGAGERRAGGASAPGFRHAQARFAPARLTHCMRWLGAAGRAHDIAADYARRCTAFGKPIGEHEGVGFMLADNEMDIQSEPAGNLARGLGARPGRARHARVEHGQGHLLGGDLAGRRPPHADIGWGSASPTTRSSRASSSRSARSASMTAPPRCIAGASPGMCCGRGRGHRDGDRRNQTDDRSRGDTPSPLSDASAFFSVIGII